MSFESTDLRFVEQHLAAVPNVCDAAVICRTDLSGVPRLIAYVVTSGTFAAQSIQEQLQTRLPERLWPASIVGVSALPVTGEGLIDEQVLISFPVLEQKMISDLQAKVLALPGVEEASIFLQQYPPVRPALYLDELNSSDARRAIETPHIKTASNSAGNSTGVPSIVQGEPLRIAVPLNLAEALTNASQTDHGIIYVEADGSESFQSYLELKQQAEQILGGLRRAGCRSGSFAILQFDRSRDFVPAFWACILGGITAVPLGVAPTYGEQNAAVGKLHKAWKLLDKPVVLSRAGFLDAIRNLRQDLDLEDWNVLLVEDLTRCDAVHEESHVQPSADALILFTSGSTGDAKGVPLTHSAILHRSAAAAQVNALDERDITLNWFPLDHVGGLVMCYLYGVFLASTQVLAPTEFIVENPLRWLDLIDKHRVSFTWAPNFAYALINDREAQLSEGSWDLSSVRVFLNGGEAVVNKTAVRFLRLLSRHGLKSNAMCPAWGMSETSSALTMCTRFQPDLYSDDTPFVEVGAPIPGSALQIVDENNNILPEGHVGKLQVRGVMITQGYYANPGLNAESFTADGWFATGDLAVIKDGRLTITGRSKDVIIVNGSNYASHEIEAVVEEIEGVHVSFTAACAVRRPGTDTDQFCVFFCPQLPDATTRLIDSIREIVMDRVGIAPAFVVAVTPDEIPKTAIGKIQRSMLRSRFERGEFDSLISVQTPKVSRGETLPAWFYERRWFSKMSRARVPERTGGPYLVFGDANGPGAATAAKLGQSCIVVAKGADFRREGKHRYQIDPRNPSHYARILEELESAGVEARHFIYEWTRSEERTAPRTPFYGLVFLIRALSVSKLRPRLTVITHHAQRILDSDALEPDQGALHGLVKTLILEAPDLECREVDLEGISSQTDVENLAAELAIIGSGAEIAYRAGIRYEAALATVDLATRRLHASPIASGGLYLITGGLGGIGTALAEWLHKHHGTKLLLLGRTAESELTAPANEASRRRGVHYEKLRRIGVDFAYCAADVADIGQLRTAVLNAEAHYGAPLLGAFHLAGELTGEDGPIPDSLEYWVSNNTLERFERVLRTKVDGTIALFEVLSQREDSLFVGFSSVLGSFGAAGFGGYCAANSALDALCEARRKLHPQTYSLAWSMWQDTGMSEGSAGYIRDIYANRGFESFPLSQGFQAMHAVLCRRHPAPLIGLNAANPAIRKHVWSDVYALESVAARCIPHGVALPQAIDAADMFGIPVTCALHGPGDDEQERQQMPQTPTEKEVASIWSEILSIEKVLLTDRFIAVGGDSLAAIRVVNRLRENFGVQVSFRDLLQRQTLAGLSQWIDNQRPAKPEPAAQDMNYADIDLDSLSEQQIDELFNQLVQGAR